MALVLGCLLAIESVADRRFVLIAVVSRSISFVPKMAFSYSHADLPYWSTFIGTGISLIAILVLLVLWSGFDLLKATHVWILTSLFIIAFSALTFW